MRGVVLSLGHAAAYFDARVIDDAVNGIGGLAVGIGATVRRAQSGQVQTYALVLFAGVVVLALIVALPSLAGGGA
ncbi:MAG: hypothetical protein HW416_1869 [Chloroflexi bacterium]|nr:hypothetical protein [Chloroflexota bacterium]